MISYQLTSALIGFGIAGSILFLVRRDQLHGPYALWWLAVAFLTVLLALWPSLLDRVAGWLGVNYPPVLALVIGIGLMLIKMLTMDLERSRQERCIRRLTQRMALLEARLPPMSRPPASDQVACEVACDPDHPTNP